MTAKISSDPIQNLTKVTDNHIGDEPVTFLDIYQIYLNSTYVLQSRLFGVENKLSFINYANIDNQELIDEIKIDDFFNNISSNKSYLISYSDLEQNIYYNKLISF